MVRQFVSEKSDFLLNDKKESKLEKNVFIFLEVYLRFLLRFFFFPLQSGYTGIDTNMMEKSCVDQPYFERFMNQIFFHKGSFSAAGL